MSLPLPLHSYADILDVNIAPLSPVLPPTPRSYMDAQYSMFTKGLGRKAVNRLPYEILHRIFRLYFDSSPIVYRKGDGPLKPGIYNNISQQISPFTLAHICSYWRAVISSIPSFWSSICIVGPLYRQAYAVRSWLSRAKRTLTNIKLIQIDPGCAPHELEEATDQVLSALIGYSSYWQSLHLEIRCVEYQCALSRINPRLLRRLEDVHLELPPWADPSPEVNRLWSHIFQAAPLHGVSWNTVDLPPPLNLPGWSKLTSINCGGRITQSDLWSILKVSHQLLELRARGIFIKNPSDLLLLPPITHGTLENLDVEFHSSPVQFYHNLILPNLTTLRVVQNPLGPDEGPRAIAGALARFIRYSSKRRNLETLTIIDATMPEESLLNILYIKELQHLTYLGIDAASDNLVSAIKLRPPPHRPVLPHLQQLEIFRKYVGHEDYDRDIQQSWIYSCFRKLFRTRPRPFTVYFHPLDEVLTEETFFIV